MDEIASGIWHWTAFHEDIGVEVSSYYVEPATTVVDPLAPDMDWFSGHIVQRVALTNRHHYRDADRFGVPVFVDEPGLEEVKDRPGVQGFEFGSEIAPGITTHGPIDPSWPDEGALHFAIGSGVLAIADGAVHYGEEIGFVPDEHLGADPESTKELLRVGYGRLLDLDFEILLFGHGSPIVGGAKERLRAFVHGEEGA